MAPWATLPFELIHEIFLRSTSSETLTPDNDAEPDERIAHGCQTPAVGAVDIASIHVLGSVCRHWYRATCHDSLWRKLFLRDFESQLGANREDKSWRSRYHEAYDPKLCRFGSQYFLLPESATICDIPVFEERSYSGEAPLSLMQGARVFGLQLAVNAQRTSLVSLPCSYINRLSCMEACRILSDPTTTEPQLKRLSHRCLHSENWLRSIKEDSPQLMTALSTRLHSTDNGNFPRVTDETYSQIFDAMISVGVMAFQYDPELLPRPSPSFKKLRRRIFAFDSIPFWITCVTLIFLHQFPDFMNPIRVEYQLLFWGFLVFVCFLWRPLLEMDWIFAFGGGIFLSKAFLWESWFAAFAWPLPLIGPAVIEGGLYNTIRATWLYFVGWAMRLYFLDFLIAPVVLDRTAVFRVLLNSVICTFTCPLISRSAVGFLNFSMLLRRVVHTVPGGLWLHRRLIVAICRHVRRLDSEWAVSVAYWHEDGFHAYFKNFKSNILSGPPRVHRLNDRKTDKTYMGAGSRFSLIFGFLWLAFVWMTS